MWAGILGWIASVGPKYNEALGLEQGSKTFYYWRQTGPGSHLISSLAHQRRYEATVLSWNEMHDGAAYATRKSQLNNSLGSKGSSLRLGLPKDVHERAAE